MQCAARLSGRVCLALALGALVAELHADLPGFFTLRNVNGVTYVTSVKNQISGTCWCFGTMGAIESNLMITGNWNAAGEFARPNLAEYHLDWWNGFNKHNNDDRVPPTGGGLTVHNGGDYLVASAYILRGEGVVRDVDGQSYDSPPARYDDGYHYFYPRDIEWYVAEPGLGNIDTVKNTLMTHGGIATCMYYSASFIDNDFCHYQPSSSSLEPNHSIVIVGWDDDHDTPAPLPGAWRCKNSWSRDWGENGYFWISYYDKHACQHAEMGAVSFQGVEANPYDTIYYHDYHGWRATKTDSTEAFNAFVASTRELLVAVGFFTACDNGSYTLRIYDRFEGGQLLDELASQTGIIAHTGFHTVDLDAPMFFPAADDFYIYLELVNGGQPYDCTSTVDVLMGAPPSRTVVESAANPGESYYRDGGVWVDLTTFDETANFCVKGYTVDAGLEVTPPEGFEPEGPGGGPFTPATKVYQFTNTDVEPISYEVARSAYAGWLTLSGDTAGVLQPDASAEVTVEINAGASSLSDGLH